MERIAVLPIDDQTADGSGAGIGAITVQILAAQLAAEPRAYVFPAADSNDAASRRATRLVAGYLTKEAGAWTLHAALRDAARQQTVRVLKDVTGSGAPALADGLAAQLGTPAFTAVRLDPVALEAALQGKGDVSILGPAAQLRLTALPNDLAGRASLAERLSAATPADSETAQRAATLLLHAGRFAEGARIFDRALLAEPDWGELHNDAAFSYALAGRTTDALKASAAYRRSDPESGNPQDTLGEVLCLLGAYPLGERQFLAGFDKPRFSVGSVNLPKTTLLRKAAEAARLARNQAEADQIFAKYAEALRQHPLLPLEQAQWDYTSGRTEPALRSLEEFAAKANLSAAWLQLSLWRARAGNQRAAAAAAKLAVDTSRNAGERNAGVMAQFVTQPDAPAAEWQLRAARQFPQPQAALFARQALVHALALHRQWTEAAAAAEALANSASAAVYNPWRYLRAAALAEAGQPDQARVYLKRGPLPRTTGEATWEFLYYPKLIELAPRIAPAALREIETQL